MEEFCRYCNTVIKDNNFLKPLFPNIYECPTCNRTWFCGEKDKIEEIKVNSFKYKELQE